MLERSILVNHLCKKYSKSEVCNCQHRIITIDNYVYLRNCTGDGTNSTWSEQCCQDGVKSIKIWYIFITGDFELRFVTSEYDFFKYIFHCSKFSVEMFYLNSTLNFGIPPVLVFQLEVYYQADRLLTGLTAQKKGTTAQWYSNKTSLFLSHMP